MAKLLESLCQGYFYIFNEAADARVSEYPLLSSPIPMLLIMVAYLYFVKQLGPKLMENREPFNIKNYIIIFNISQILMCGFIVYKFMEVCFFQFNWRCEPIDYSRDRVPMMQLFYTWIYFLIKILDLLDTIFFVLRKKFNQISFLHVYHHTGMVVMSWLGCKFVGGGHGLFVGFVNCIVHTFMYLYYLITIWDEKYKKSIWWKKHITQLQMAQFAFFIVMFSQILFQPNCKYPKWVSVEILTQGIIMFVLFGDFYYNTYIKEKPAAATLGDKTSEGQFTRPEIRRADKQKTK